MNLEELKKMLEAGEITQEEYDAKVKELENKGGSFDINKLLENEQFAEFLNKKIQSETDKVRTEYSKKLKDRDTELENLKNEKLTDEEKFQLEKQKFEEDRKIFEKQRLDADYLTHLSKEKLPPELKDIVPGSTIEKKIENTGVLLGIMNGWVEEQVQAKLKDEGYQFEKGKGNQNEGIKKFHEYGVDELIRIREKDENLYQQIFNNR